MAAPLSVEMMYRARQMYEEVWEDGPRKGRRKYSMMDVAAALGISETSVLRAVKNRGRFANLQNTPLPPSKTEMELNEEAAASQARFVEEMKKNKMVQEISRADAAVEELKGKGQDVSDAVKDKLKGYLG